MQLSLHAEYALRVLLYLGARPKRVVSTEEISSAYGISRNHLVRVVQTLAEDGYIQAAPGRSGGLSLTVEPRAIRLGEVVRQAEPNFRLAECFDKTSNTCVITSVCTLRPVLQEALDTFLATLNRYTLADLLERGVAERISAKFVAISRGKQ